MTNPSSLPESLTKGYRAWLRDVHTPGQSKFQTLVDDGQHPEEMIISCCDSRVNVTEIFAADAGDMFIHRNIAALVPPCDTDTHNRGTSAAVEYAVRVLEVKRLIIMGHSQCGGVAGCLDKFDGHAPDLLKVESFVGRWIDILRPGYDRVPKDAPRADRLKLLEQEAVRVSLENLMSFPWIADAVDAGSLELIGLWIDIAAGRLEIWSTEDNSFVEVQGG